jgi:hypothetical protein
MKTNNRKNMARAERQWTPSSSVASAITSMVEQLMFTKYKIKQNLSSNWIYDNRTDQNREGMQIDNALDICKNKGLLTELSYEYRKWRRLGMMSKAKEIRITSSKKVLSVDEIKQYLTNEKYVMIVRGTHVITLVDFNDDTATWFVLDPKDAGLVDQIGYDELQYRDGYVIFDVVVTLNNWFLYSTDNTIKKLGVEFLTKFYREHNFRMFCIIAFIISASASIGRIL